MSLAILIIEKSTEIKVRIVKNYKENELYKKCGFKNVGTFKLQYSWDYLDITFNLYGKSDGTQNMKNNYVFPYPLNTMTFYGNCALVAYHKDKQENVPITLQLWLQYLSSLKQSVPISSEKQEVVSCQIQQLAQEIKIVNEDKELDYEEYV